MVNNLFSEICLSMATNSGSPTLEEHLMCIPSYGNSNNNTGGFSIRIGNKDQLFFNSLPIDKILGLSELKTFAEDNINVTQKLEFALGRVENFVGKGENASHHYFLLFPKCFEESFEVGILW